MLGQIQLLVLPRTAYFLAPIGKNATLEILHECQISQSGSAAQSLEKERFSHFLAGQ